MDFFLSKPIRRPALKHVLKTYCPPIVEEDEGCEKTPPADKPVKATVSAPTSLPNPMSGQTKTPFSMKAGPSEHLDSPAISPSTVMG